MPGTRLTISEAAQQLGVSRRRAQAMVLNGQLPAERIGHQWIISAASVRSLRNNIWREPGRPLAASSAWKLFDDGRALAAAGHPEQLDRIRRRLRSRAKHLELYVHPSLLRRLGTDSRIVIGGRGAAEQLGVPVNEDLTVDAYVRASYEPELLRKLSAREVGENANLHLHVVDDAAWPFDRGQRYVKGWLAWMDLADGQERAADTLLDRLAGWRSVA